MKDLLALAVEAQTTGSHMVFAYSINIDQGHHVAELALPTWAAKDSDNKVLITDQTHTKKIDRHCHPHGPLTAQLGAFFTKLVPLSWPVTSPFQPVPCLGQSCHHLCLDSHLGQSPQCLSPS